MWPCINVTWRANKWKILWDKKGHVIISFLSISNFSAFCWIYKGHVFLWNLRFIRQITLETMTSLILRRLLSLTLRRFFHIILILNYVHSILILWGKQVLIQISVIKPCIKEIWIIMVTSHPGHKGSTFQVWFQVKLAFSC